MVSSAEEVCNIALTKIGYEGAITSLTEGSKGARVMNTLYESTRDEILRRYLWRFARKRAVLAPLTEEPAFKNYSGENYFQYPDDCLRIVGTDQDYFEAGEPWAREGDKIIAPTDTLRLVYIRKVTTVANFDPCFVECFTDRLGEKAAMPILKSTEMKQMMAQAYGRSVIQAAHASATEQDGERFIAEAFLRRR